MDIPYIKLKSLLLLKSYINLNLFSLENLQGIQPSFHNIHIRSCTHAPQTMTANLYTNIKVSCLKIEARSWDAGTPEPAKLIK
jgi:hypothetical protein